MNKLWKCILSFLMAALLLPVSPQPIQAETDTFINDFDIGMGIDQVTYIGEWNTDQNYPDLSMAAMIIGSRLRQIILTAHWRSSFMARRSSCMAIWSRWAASSASSSMVRK